MKLGVLKLPGHCGKSRHPYPSVRYRCQLSSEDTSRYMWGHRGNVSTHPHKIHSYTLQRINRLLDYIGLSRNGLLLD